MGAILWQQTCINMEGRLFLQVGHSCRERTRALKKTKHWKREALLPVTTNFHRNRDRGFFFPPLQCAVSRPNEFPDMWTATPRIPRCDCITWGILELEVHPLGLVERNREVKSFAIQLLLVSSLIKLVVKNDGNCGSAIFGEPQSFSPFICC